MVEQPVLTRYLFVRDQRWDHSGTDSAVPIVSSSQVTGAQPAPRTYWMADGTSLTERALEDIDPYLVWWLDMY